jgi:hypothetical protein
LHLLNAFVIDVIPRSGDGSNVSASSVFVFMLARTDLVDRL